MTVAPAPDPATEHRATEGRAREGNATERRDALVERLFRANIAMLDLMTVYLGDRLGLYRALADGGPATPADLAERTRTDERYVREWLEQQATTQMLEVDGIDAPADARRYRLPPAHAEVLTDPDSLAYPAPLARFNVGVARRLPDLVRAFRSGGGIDYGTYDADVREGQADANRPLFANLLGQEWLPSIPDVHARLLAAPAARIADIGCGAGWSSIAMARAYPSVTVHGFDADDRSIDLARANAAAAGVADRVAFGRHDVSELAREGTFDLVTAFECIHDMARPVDALRTMRRLVGERGAAIVADERVAERFGALGDDVERLMYAWSVLFCLPTGRAEEPSAATGTVMRPATLERYAAEASFGRVEILPIEHDLWRFYRLVP